MTAGSSGGAGGGTKNCEIVRENFLRKLEIASRRKHFSCVLIDLQKYIGCLQISSIKL